MKTRALNLEALTVETFATTSESMETTQLTPDVSQHSNCDTLPCCC